MDNSNFSEVKRPRKRKRSAGRVWNILTLFVLIATLCIVVAFVQIYNNPYSILNPFPPAAVNPTNTFANTSSASATPGPRFTLVPSWTPTKVIIQPTDTKGPTHTPLYTDTVEPSATPIPPTFTPIGGKYAFEVRPGSPEAVDAAQYQPDLGCDWLGVAGEAMSLNGEAVRGLFVQLGGDLPGVNTEDNVSMTGMAPEYGDGGFEITLSDQLIASSGRLWIQLLDQQNLPLSGRVYFDTYDDCERNLILIYFDQVQ